MPPARGYWVIVSGDTPTAFRSKYRDDLLPTLRQLQRTQPDTELKWFDRGRMWTTPDEARAALIARRKAPSTRGRDWRPGGTHKDPRAKYQLTRDQKRARFKRNLGRPAKPGQPSRPTGSSKPRKP